MSIIKHVTLQKIVAHDCRYDPCIFMSLTRYKYTCENNRNHKFFLITWLVFFWVSAPYGRCMLRRFGAMYVPIFMVNVVQVDAEMTGKK